MPDAHPNHPEPLPPACRLAAAAFLSAVEGYIDLSGGGTALRLTMHRTMTVAGSLYIQQLADYLGSAGGSGAGRVFPVTLGAMGEAYRQRKIVRTKPYPDEAGLKADIAVDMRDTNDSREIDAIALSYLAMPILGANGKPTCLLYAETKDFNYFAGDERVETIWSMTRSFAELVDSLEERPIARIRNFPLPAGTEVVGGRSLYRRVQEVLDTPKPPRFQRISSFNYEIVV